MLFPRRTWALRVTEGMGLRVKSNETTLLADLLIWSAKQDEAMFASGGMPAISKPEGILMGALTMVNNQSAVSKVATELGLSQSDSLELLRQMQASGLALVKQHNFENLVTLAKRRGLL